MIIYSFPQSIGSWGLGNLMFQQVLALYDAGILEKVYARDNCQSLIPEKYIDVVHSETDFEFDRCVSGLLAKDIEKDPEISLLGMRSLHQQNMLLSNPKYKGKILKYCGSTHPLVQNSIMEYEKTFQSRAGISVTPTDYSSLRYGVLECEGVDKFSCASNLVKRSFLSCGFQDQELSVLPLGVDTDVYFKDINSVYKKSEHGDFNIGYSATNPIRKGLLYLYNEFLKLDHPSKQLHLRTSVSIDHPRVLNYPYLDTMKALYNDIHVFVLPSSEDGFGMTILEAMACGVPVMTTKMAGASEIITHGVDGFVYNTPQECCAAIHDIFKRKEELPDVGERARKTAERYTWESYRQKFARWAESVINN